MPVNPTPVYADLNDEEIDAESPLTESVMTRLRDNPRATFRNDGGVPTAELQLAEGMRTAETDTAKFLGNDGVSKTAWVTGAIANTAAYSNSVNTTTGYAYITLPATGTFLAWGQFGQDDGSDDEVLWGFCLVVNNSESGECYIRSNPAITRPDSNGNKWQISGGQLRFGQFSGGSSEEGAIILLKVA